MNQQEISFGLLVSDFNKRNINTTTIKEKIYNLLSIIYDIIKLFLHAFKYYLFWIIIHFIASQLYVQYCSPPTFYGFVLSPFLTPTPHCQGLRWIVYNSGGVINNMWFVFGTWLCANIFTIKSTFYT